MYYNKKSGLKNLLFALWKKNSEYDFIWIGNNQEFLTEKLPENFKVTGFVKNIVYYIFNLTGIIFTSREDPFPLALLEFLYLEKKLLHQKYIKII